MLLHTEACIKINLYTKQLLHTEAFTPRSLLPHFLTFDPHFVQKVASDASTSQFYISLWCSAFILCSKLTLLFAFLHQLLTFESYFARKGYPSALPPALRKKRTWREKRERERDTEREEREQREDVKIWRCKIHRCLQYNEDAYLTSFLRKIFAQMLSGKTYSQGCSQHPKCTGWSNGQLERQNHPLPLCGYIYIYT